MESNTKFSLLRIIEFASVIFGFFIAFIVFDDYINSKIQKKLTSEEYISNLAKSLRPFLIFNQKGTILYDHGAAKYIENIAVELGTDQERVKKITITMTEYLQNEPLLECLGPDQYEINITRNKKLIWVFDFVRVYGFGDNPNNRFRLEILK